MAKCTNVRQRMGLVTQVEQARPYVELEDLREACIALEVLVGVDSPAGAG